MSDAVHLTSRIVARMQRQLGLITRSQLIDEDGVPSVRVDWWLRSGVLESVQPAVYRRTGGFVPATQPLLAAIMVCGQGAVAGARASLRLQGANRLRSTGLEVAIPHPRHIRRKPFPVSIRVLRPGDCTTAGPVPVMRAVRAVIDLAPSLGHDETRRLIDDLRRDGRLVIADLDRRATELSHLHGARLVVAAITDGTFDQENDGERTLADLLTGVHPQPRWQVDDLVPGRRLDACWVEALYALEYDGRGHHLLPTDRDADGMRDLESTAGHLLVHRITAGMIREQAGRTRQHIAETYERRLLEVAALTDAGVLPPELVVRTQRVD